MKILFSSYVFDPSVGGIESVSKILAEKYAAAGHSVHLITQTAGGEIFGANYRITRRPSLLELIRLLRWCDVLFQNNISLRNLIPALLLTRPTVIAHHAWIQNVHGEIGWRNRIKYALLHFVTNVAVSQAVVERLSVPATVVGNPYDDRLFRILPGVGRDKTIAFLGRLVSEKGVDLLLRAIKLLQADGLTPDLTIIGSGPEERGLRQLAVELGIDGRVAFVGRKSGDELVDLLNQHRILAVPSRCAETFGLVALEGIACGCVIVGSEKGGLKEAIADCGLTFENGNVRALADSVKELLNHPETITRLRAKAPAHLARFRADAVASAYLNAIQNTAT